MVLVTENLDQFVVTEHAVNIGATPSERYMLTVFIPEVALSHIENV
jgi:hypothetical protein